MQAQAVTEKVLRSSVAIYELDSAFDDWNFPEATKKNQKFENRPEA